ncbi:MAG TPA: MBL fold metallo-hydrolase [Candidatus Limnocylindria bacterium]|nr:MBL fold metallo-hydrolase [Candidatus Limnocylindria bacterium]
MIDIRFFGRGAGFNPPEGNTNAYIVRGRHLLLIDCGESTFARAFASPGLKGWESATVLMTHLHADHSGSLASFCAYNFFALGRRVAVVHPVPTVTELLRLQGVGPEVYDYRTELPAHLELTAQPRRVRHAEDMQSFGYILRDRDEAVYYSGDSAEFPEEIATMLKSEELARVYHDIAAHDSSYHCPVSAVEAAVPRELRPRVFAMHLDPGSEATFREKGFSVVSAQA